MPVEASPCSTATGSDLPFEGGEGLILIIGTYLGLAILGLKFIFIAVLFPKNSLVIIIEMTGLHDSLRYVVYIFMNAALYFCNFYIF